MCSFKEFDTVRIIKLLTPDRELTGDDELSRQPKVGDVGTVVHFNDVNNPKASMVVENTNDEGYCIWLADFFPEELELITQT